MTNFHRRSTDKQVTILCIDDESENLRVLSNLFKNSYHLVLCKHAQKAVELAKQHQPSLILLDVVMPEIDGFELFEQLRNETEIQNIPVIFITGLNDPSDEEKGLKLGACDYIQKPFSPAIVRARVATHLEIVRQRRLLENLVHIDALTELPNRRCWERDIEIALQNAKDADEKITIGVVDLDHFKLYNDHYGHQQGDIILRKVSNAIARTLFEYGGQIYRCGGEEFFFFIPDKTQQNVPEILQETIDTIESLAIEHKGSPTSKIVSISLGAVQSEPNQHSTKLIELADQSLYQVKNTTRNSFLLHEVS